VPDIEVAAMMEDEGRLVEHGKPWTLAEPLAPRELNTVLAGLGPCGDAQARLAAVVALLAGGSSDSPALGGAFAAEPNVTGTLTDGFHICLREPPVNGGQQGTQKSLPRKQC
jgi:hypothetical protein